MKNGTEMARLRDSVARIEQRYRKSFAALYLETGLPCVDEALRGGLRRGVVHEFLGAGYDRVLCARPTHFIARVLARATGPVIWIVPAASGQGTLTLAGLETAGLASERLLCVEAEPARLVGTMEDVLRTPGVTAVVADLTGPLSLTASRRLHLAAEHAAATGFLLHRHDRPLSPNACWTRWRVGAAPSGPVILGRRALLPFAEAFSLSLLRRRGGEALSWRIGTDHAAPSALPLAAALAHDTLAQGASSQRSGLATGAVWA
ncbi:ImuA family protein [Swaminathania salitolerans]|uniref:Protein ImuA n=1 Tax=Swaminathania salitolerans TaxID=182838 RepID=A0A511BXX2_9PROT|nr:hypothetical protein [Swaminathania salitolerans]GBQ13998.1 hypothetical protein AA21291_1686 [Swaminathania salitolerans LMG 21291]GEL02878.1 hypothetical protein SSA02_20410 [Swaminathania salitolerans]